MDNRREMLERVISLTLQLRDAMTMCNEAGIFPSVAMVSIYDNVQPALILQSGIDDVGTLLGTAPVMQHGFPTIHAAGVEIEYFGGDENAC